MYVAEVVEWLMPSTAVHEVEGSIPAEGMFSEKLSPARTFPSKYMDTSKSPEWQTSKVHIGKTQSVRATIKEVSRVSITSEHVKDLTIKMATSTIMTPTTSNIAYYRGVTA